MAMPPGRERRRTSSTWRRAMPPTRATPRTTPSRRCRARWTRRATCGASSMAKCPRPTMTPSAWT
eukprot:9402734-Prorocentrum_lima.AAC.1